MSMFLFASCEKKNVETNNKINKDVSSKDFSNIKKGDSKYIKANNDVVSSSIQKSPKKNKEGKMAVSVQITLIICLTVLALTFMSKFIDDE